MPGWIQTVHFGSGLMVSGRPAPRYVRGVTTTDCSIYITPTHIDIPCKTRRVAERLTSLTGEVIEKEGTRVFARFPLKV